MYFKRRILPALNRAGIDKIRFYDLRHTYASLLLANGAPDEICPTPTRAFIYYYDNGFVYPFVAGS